MRHFDYRDDYSTISIDVKSYTDALIKELTCLIEIEGLDVYKNALNAVNEFNAKYPDLNAISDQIADELLTPENVDYAFYNHKFKEDASETGMEFKEDLYKIFALEESLSKLAEKQFEKMTPFEQIENGGDFMVVGHACSLLPGVSNNPNYRKNHKEYLSCSLFTNNELNTFQNENTVYLMGVNEDNFVSASYFDVVTREASYPSIHSLKEVATPEGKKYIDIGFTHDSRSFALSIATPRVVEKLSLERESKIEDPLTNEVVLLRSKTVSNNALLIGDETDLLIYNFQIFRSYNIDFKCINRGLYNERNGKERYDKNKLQDLDRNLSKIGEYDKHTLEDYYKNVVLKMHYSDDILARINNSFSKYIDIESINPQVL